jgi:predicted Zn-dependent protease
VWRYRNLGKALFETPTSQSQAAAELKKALGLAPNSFRDRLNYGLALLSAGQIDQAIAELRKAQAQDPQPPYTWFNLG